MPAEKIFVVAAREYISRIKTKGFWISTLILPVAIIAMMFLPAVFITKSGISHDLVLVDETGRLASELVEGLGRAKGPDGQIAQFKVEVQEPTGDPESQRAGLNERVLDGDIDAWLWIGPDILLPRSSDLTEKERTRRKVTYHGESVSNFITQDVLQDSLTSIVRRLRLTDAGYDPEVIEDLLPRVRFETVRVSSQGEKTENTMVGFILAYALAMLLYILIVIYGQQILNGVIEEKMSRVVEVVISTVKPFELMMGKLIGIGLVGLTQVSIWIGAVVAVTTPALVAAFVTLPEEFTLPKVSLWVVLNFGIFFFLGYFVYCTFYAAIGAAFNNIQEAQQFSIVAVVYADPDDAAGGREISSRIGGPALVRPDRRLRPLHGLGLQPDLSHRDPDVRKEAHGQRAVQVGAARLTGSVLRQAAGEE
jgi:ABC-2 type transport system permease protein